MTDASKRNGKDDDTSPEDTDQEPTRAETESASVGDEAAAAGGGTSVPAPSHGGGDGDGRRRALTLATTALIVALLVAAVAVAGGWWVWDRLQALQAASDEYAERTEVTELREQLRSRDERLTGRVDNLAEEHASHVRSLARAEETMETIRESQTRANERMDRIQELAAAHRDDWIHAEAGYLYGIARYRTRFHGDVDGALQALKEADRLLEELGAETVEERQAVAEAINALLEVRKPDRDAMAAELRELIQGVEAWPLKQPERRVETGEMPRQRDAELDSLEGWANAGARAWEQFREAIGSLVVVRRDEAPPRLMAPEESHYLRENLRLQLLTARVALLDGQTRIYRDSLADVADWIGRHFDTEDDSVRAAQERVGELREAQITAEMPDLGAILPEHGVPGRNADGEDAE